MLYFFSSSSKLEESEQQPQNLDLADDKGTAPEPVSHRDLLPNPSAFLSQSNVPLNRAVGWDDTPPRHNASRSATVFNTTNPINNDPFHTPRRPTRNNVSSDDTISNIPNPNLINDDGFYTPRRG